MDCPGCGWPVTYVAFKLAVGEFRVYDCDRCAVHAWTLDGDTCEIPTFLRAVARHYEVPASHRPDFVEAVVMRAGVTGDRAPQQRMRLAPTLARTAKPRSASAA